MTAFQTRLRWVTRKESFKEHFSLLHRWQRAGVTCFPPDRLPVLIQALNYTSRVAHRNRVARNVASHNRPSSDDHIIAYCDTGQYDTADPYEDIVAYDNWRQ